MCVTMRNQTINLLFWLNYILVILYISRISDGNTQPAIDSIVPLLIASLMLIDVSYISSCNIRENKVISLFCGLLVLDCWYMLLLSDTSKITRLVFAALSPVIWYASIKFILMFLFQGCGYKFRKVINAILPAACIMVFIGIGLSDRMYAVLYEIQFLVSWCCFLFVIICHWKRVIFVIKSEKKCIFFSVAATTTIFFIYYFATIEIPYHISNFGVYITVLLFGMSVHGIVVREHNSCPLSAVFSRRQTLFIISTMIIILGLMIFAMHRPLNELFAAINLLFAFIYLCNIILGQCLKEGKSSLIKEGKYYTALQQFQREESLKADFANFLHDDVLQDTLSVKNMITKAYRPDIQDIIAKALDNLNKRIRERMQDDHPVILKNLTIKENYRSLTDAVSQSFPTRNVHVSFECSDTFFLVEPYDILVYRLLKELLTNIYKHSDGSRAWITLTMEDETIDLCVADNGTADADCLLSADKTNHKGIASILEQIRGINGVMDISDRTPQGICIRIRIPMKGDVSYQYFIS